MDSSLEIVPKEIVHHVDVIRSSRIRKKRAEEMLLEDYLHYRAIRKLERSEKRGRPDILHRCLLLALDSNLFSEIYVHTVQNLLIKIDVNTKLPRTYERFRGLMEKLLLEGKIEAGGKVLLEVVDYKLEDVLDRAVVLWEKGDRKDVCKRISESRTICIGAFPHGDFEEETMKAFKKANATFLSFGEAKLSSLYATCKVICCVSLNLNN